VTFTVIGGEGEVVNPVTGLSAPEVMVLTDEQGEAAAPLVLGT
jgi:hypothetical protein